MVRRVLKRVYYREKAATRNTWKRGKWLERGMINRKREGSVGDEH